MPKNNNINDQTGGPKGLCLLTDPLLSAILSGSRTTHLSLPALMGAITRGELADLPTLRRHHRHPLKAFLAQLAAVAMTRAGLREVPADDETWREIIRDADGDDWPNDEPWKLVQPDTSLPAFFQPPTNVPAGEFRELSAPDDIDLPIHSRQFEPRAATDVPCAPDQWIYTLIALQTHGGFLGRGNHGIARMNGGPGSRPHFSLTPAPDLGAQIKRDIDVLANMPHKDPNAPALTWTIPWNGTESETLRPDELHPLTIEICRLLRLKKSAGAISALKATTEAHRTGPGYIYDPWAPRSAQTGVVLTVDEKGLPDALLSSLLSDPDTWSLPDLALPTAQELAAGRPMYLTASVLARSPGRTDGYHERLVRLGPETLADIARRDPESRQGWTERPPSRHDYPHLSALREAVSVYLAGGMRRNSGRAKTVAAELAPKTYRAMRGRSLGPAEAARAALEKIAEEHGPQALDRPRALVQARALLLSRIRK